MADTEVYVFTGAENGDKHDAVSALKKSAAERLGALDEYTYYAGDVRVADVVAQLQNVSLFSAALFVVLKNAEQIKLKADVELLLAYIKSAAGSANTLVLESDENSIDKKLEGAVPAAHKKIFWEMFENRRPQWLQQYFRKNGFSVTAEAVEQILSMVENNTESLKAECSRFFYCLEKGHVVTPADVDAILSHNREENAFTLFEAMADGKKAPAERLENALEILQKIRLSREANGVSILAGLTYCFRQLRLWHSLNANGAVPDDGQLRSNGLGGKNKARYSTAARIWGAGATASVLALLASTDMAIREGGSSLEDTQLCLALYAIIIKNGLHPLRYERP